MWFQCSIVTLIVFLKRTQKGIFSEQAVLQQSVGQTIEKEVNRIFKAKELLSGGSIAKEDYSAIKKIGMTGYADLKMSFNAQWN